jgi:hypothetical protein
MNARGFLADLAAPGSEREPTHCAERAMAVAAFREGSSTTCTGLAS